MATRNPSTPGSSRHCPSASARGSQPKGLADLLGTRPLRFGASRATFDTATRAMIPSHRGCTRHRFRPVPTSQMRQRMPAPDTAHVGFVKKLSRRTRPLAHGVAGTGEPDPGNCVDASTSASRHSTPKTGRAATATMRKGTETQNEKRGSPTIRSLPAADSWDCVDASATEHLSTPHAPHRGGGKQQ